jgi:O-methyltransferase
MTMARWSTLAERLRRKLQEPFASPTSKAVRRDRLTYCSIGKLARLEHCVAQAIKQKVPGAVIEFGVALGGSAILLAKQCNDRPFHGFDVFGMIPAPSSEKDDEKSKKRYEVIVSGQSTGLGNDTYYGYRRDLFSEVIDAFARHQCPVDSRRVFLHKGLFDQTWRQFPASEQVAVAHIDCDWYDPVKFCISAVLPRLNRGSTLIFDDYHDYGGAHTAVDELLSEHREWFTADMGENAILVRRL